MGARQGRKVAARQARLAQEAREAQARAAARRRLQALGGILVAALVVVVAAVAISSDGGLRGVSQMLCAAGIGIAGYLNYVHYAGLRPVCGVSHGCETVQTSAYATLLGVPVALLGLISYVVIFISLLLRGDRPLLTGYALTLIAFAFSVYLTYRELFTIHAVCSWCVSSAIVFTVLTIVSSRRVLRCNYAGAGAFPA
jgi:uncharacterized membrane protein